MTSKDFSEYRTEVIQEIAKLTREMYVYPDRGALIADKLLNQLADGDYDKIANENDLALQITSELRSLSNDLHWRLIFDPDRTPELVDPESEKDEELLKEDLRLAQKTNFGFERVERLKGNVGYVDIREFVASKYAGSTAVAAMNFVANCDALIIDIRQAHGGHPCMVQLITSYLVDPEPIHINTLYYRPSDNIQQFWTFPHVP